MIDAGMTDEYGGHAAALEVDAQGRMTAVYPDSREPLAVEPRAARAEPAVFPLRRVGARPTFPASHSQSNQGGAR